MQEFSTANRMLCGPATQSHEIKLKSPSVAGIGMGRPMTNKLLILGNTHYTF